MSQSCSEIGHGAVPDSATRGIFQDKPYLALQNYWANRAACVLFERGSGAVAVSRGSEPGWHLRARGCRTGPDSLCWLRSGPFVRHGHGSSSAPGWGCGTRRATAIISGLHSWPLHSCFYPLICWHHCWALLIHYHLSAVYSTVPLQHIQHLLRSSAAFKLHGD